jgi:hypothetical protein
MNDLEKEGCLGLVLLLILTFGLIFDKEAWLLFAIVGMWMMLVIARRKYFKRNYEGVKIRWRPWGYKAWIKRK